jgi:hypothetical protein
MRVAPTNCALAWYACLTSASKSETKALDKPIAIVILLIEINKKLIAVVCQRIWAGACYLR